LPEKPDYGFIAEKEKYIFIPDYLKQDEVLLVSMSSVFLPFPALQRTGKRSKNTSELILKIGQSPISF